MITIFFPGHSSHFDGKFTTDEIQGGLEFIQTRYPRPPFSRSRIVVRKEPGPLNCTVDDEKPLPNPKVSDKISSGLLQSDLAYCEEWRVTRKREMEDYMASPREPGLAAENRSGTAEALKRNELGSPKGAMFKVG